MKEQLEDIQQFLELISKIEEKVLGLIQNTNLTDTEKSYILEHILIVPGKSEVTSEVS